VIRLLARHPTAANLLMALILAAGLLSLPSLRRETFPDFTASEVEVRAVYPGATAEEIEETVVQRVEDAVDGVRFVAEVRSEPREGVGVVTVEMTEGGDLVTFKDEVTSEVDAIDDFPDDVEEPVITELGTSDLVLVLMVSGPMAPPDLKASCEGLKDRLQTLPEVSLVEIEGVSDHQLRVELSAEALLQYGLDAARVADLIARQSVDLPAGVIETRERDVLLRFAEERRTPAELEDLVLIARPGGAEVRLGDVGRVVDRFERDEDRVLAGGRRAGLLGRHAPRARPPHGRRDRDRRERRRPPGPGEVAPRGGRRQRARGLGRGPVVVPDDGLRPRPAHDDLGGHRAGPEGDPAPADPRHGREPGRGGPRRRRPPRPSPTTTRPESGNETGPPTRRAGPGTGGVEGSVVAGGGWRPRVRARWRGRRPSRRRGRRRARARRGGAAGST